MYRGVYRGGLGGQTPPSSWSKMFSPIPSPSLPESPLTLAARLTAALYVWEGQRQSSGGVHVHMRGQFTSHASASYITRRIVPRLMLVSFPVYIQAWEHSPIFGLVAWSRIMERGYIDVFMPKRHRIGSENLGWVQLQGATRGLPASYKNTTKKLFTLSAVTAAASQPLIQLNPPPPWDFLDPPLMWLYTVCACIFTVSVFAPLRNLHPRVYGLHEKCREKCLHDRDA